MYSFSPQTLIILKESGWHAGRQVDISVFEESLLKDGFTLFPIAASFLAEFGDLDIVFSNRIGQKANFHFNVKKAVEEVDPLWAQQDYYRRLGDKQLCVIGQAYTDHMTLMMSETGEVYGGFDDFLCKIANSGVDAIKRICDNERAEEIP
ncbi:SUKH-3 immunity protein of toxin-antitoxin system [Mucilaginibacter yixingensis]|uniref:SUKH-3 immunity protein of toxin-antitoxin system n=1 Tax=Mucilaginibacter yixingensis TaxID=1295612 RepID=A0A2T5JEZ7_9SPHI|nr:SUKH-3 domain-containing protein [Mucilaginibacter yixingensis]PTR01008.1 SUKH-3 immunity protein of toxin-antitoxin system [Mucilaginibacter yixingensis]